MCQISSVSYARYELTVATSIAGSAPLRKPVLTVEHRPHSVEQVLPASCRNPLYCCQRSSWLLCPASLPPSGAQQAPSQQP